MTDESTDDDTSAATTDPWGFSPARFEEGMGEAFDIDSQDPSVH